MQADAPVVERSRTWYEQVAAGRELLGRTSTAVGYADRLPGVNPNRLAEGAEFRIISPALAYVSIESVQGDYFAIRRPDAYDLTELEGDTSRMMVLRPRTRFVVEEINYQTDDEGRRVIWLGHPEEDAPQPSGDSNGEPPARDAPSGGSAGRAPAEPTVESSAADALRHQAALAVPAALALPLSAGELGRVMGVVRGQALAGAGGGAGSLADCVAVVGGFLRRVYPRQRLARGDDAWGLGGVAGVRERLVPGGVWARVGSWKELAGAVAVAGAGASAVVLVSRAGGEQGHALVLHETTDGPRWADPGAAGPDGVVTAGLPGDVRSAVAAWAVLVDRNGRVVPPPEPGAWAAPESAGGEWMLTDPPLRHDFGAMGIEIERHNVRLSWPGGRDLPEKIILLHSGDGMVRVAVDHGDVAEWLDVPGLAGAAPAPLQGPLPQPSRN